MMATSSKRPGLAEMMTSPDTTLFCTPGHISMPKAVLAHNLSYSYYDIPLTAPLGQRCLSKSTHVFNLVVPRMNSTSCEPHPCKYLSKSHCQGLKTSQKGTLRFIDAGYCILVRGDGSGIKFVCFFTSRERYIITFLGNRPEPPWLRCYYVSMD